MASSNSYIDLFAGCGGLSLGLRNSGWKGIFAIEKSQDAFQTLKHNLIDSGHYDWPNWLPTSPLNIDTILEQHKDHLLNLRGKVDLIAGGPPCQGFSTAGLRNENDARNGLIRSYLRFIMLVRPKLILFENVKGFTQKFSNNRSKGLQYSEYVERVLRFFKYEVKGQMVDFSEFGVPQKRTRFILVGIRRDIAHPLSIKPLDLFTALSENKNAFLRSKGLSQATCLQDAISDLSSSKNTVTTPDRKKFKSGLYSNASSTFQEYCRTGQTESNVPDSHSFASHRIKTIKRLKYILRNCRKNYPIDQITKSKFGLSKHTMIPLDGKLPCRTITTLPDDYLHYSQPRILTVRECARIQTFPDWFEFKGVYTTGGPERKNRTPRYTQVGNAIPPLFSEQVGIVLKKIV